MVKRSSIFKSCFLVFLCSLCFFTPVSAALPEGTLNFYAQNNILFYDPSNCESPQPISGNQITWIGDSYSVGAQSIIEKTFPGIELGTNIKSSKHFATDINDNPSGLTILQEIADKNNLKQYIVFALGTNDQNSDLSSNIDTIENIIGSSRTLILVTPRTYNYTYDKNTIPSIKNAKSKYSNIIIADWAFKAESNLDVYFTPSVDDIHPNQEGYEAWVKTIEDALPNNSSSTSIGDNKDYEGNQVFTDDQWERVQEFKPLYEEAAKSAGIPWPMLAAIHVRESNLSRTNPNADGIFQILALDVPSGHENTDAEFLEQAKMAAEYLKNSIKGDTSDDAVKRAFFSYNGVADVYIAQARDLGFTEEQAKNGEGSPYVMNRADKQRDPNYNKTTWGQIKKDYGPIEYPANMDYGAYIYYLAAGGNIGSDICSNSGAGNMDLNQTAIDLAWPIGDPHNVWGGGGATNGTTMALTASGPYMNALTEVGLTTYGEAFVEIGASCDAFVATVARYSGVDPNFACCGIGNQTNYLRGEGSTKWEEITYNDTNDTSFLKPGDILISVGHIKMYIEQDGEGREAQASHGEHSGEISNGVSLYDSYNGSKFWVFRAR